MADSKPPFFQRLSDYLFPQDALTAPHTARVTNDSTQLLRRESSTTSSLNQAAVTMTQTTLHPARPALMRAATSPAAPTTNASISPSSTPLLSRPILNQAATATDVARTLNTPAKPAPPTLLRRATNVVAASLALSLQSTQRDKDMLRAPTYWADHIHRKPLLQIWDKPVNLTGDTSSIDYQLSTVLNEMLHQYAELGSGDVALTKKWIEHVLGLCLRQPFSTSKNAGRWQNLATAAGPRANWGPW